MPMPAVKARAFIPTNKAPPAFITSTLLQPAQRGRNKNNVITEVPAHPATNKQYHVFIVPFSPNKSFGQGSESPSADERCM
jgi:hypothetical protein